MKSFKLSIQSCLILMNLILLCLLFPSISLLLLHEEKKFQNTQLERTVQQLKENLKERSGALSKSMALSAGQAVAGYDYTFLNIMTEQLVADDSEIMYCIIMTNERRAIAHSNPELTGSILDGAADYRAADLIPNHIFPEGADHSGKTKRQHTWDVYFLDLNKGYASFHSPILEAISPLYNGSQLWGVLRLGFSLRSLNEQTQIAREEFALKLKQYTIYLITITAAFFSIGVIIAGYFTRVFVRSMKVLADGVNRVSDGDLDHMIDNRPIAILELNRFSETFNEMTWKLRESYKKLDEYSSSLEQKVIDRTRKLKEAQMNLLQQAHEAGMAEMAVGILHNIGNAITPAKIDASLLLNKLHNSPLRSGLHDIFSGISGMIDQSTGLPDEEKERLSKFVDLLPLSIEEEYGHCMEKLAEIQKKHQHIESIINLQMRYAHLFGKSEMVDVSLVLEDALKLVEDSIANRSLDIVKTLSPAPKVRIAQAKLMQIIVNLIKNSIEAMDAKGPGTNRLELSVSFEREPVPCVILRIKDNGIGFSQDETDKMFSFGYTTKAKGSGFGLHSCANYLIANKGSLSAESDGKGKGAEFVVRFFDFEKESLPG